MLFNTSVLSCKMVGKQHIQQKPDSEGMSLSGLLPFPATPLLMVGDPCQAYPRNDSAGCGACIICRERSCREGGGSANEGL